METKERGKDRPKSVTIEKDGEKSTDKKKKTSDKKKKDKKDNVSSEVSFLEHFAEATTNDDTWKTQGQNFIWITDPKEVYVVAEVTDREKNSLDFIVTTQFGESQRCRIADIFPLNPPSYNYAEDVSGLYHLSTFAIHHVLKMRYEKLQLYTYCGPYLIYMNPFVAVPKKFSDRKIKKYSTSRRDQISPHIYSLAESILTDLLRKSVNQTMMFVGGTNSGKSRNVDEFIRYMEVTVQCDCRQYKDALTIINAFGNATTLHNSNASRYAKTVEFNFASNRLIGCNIQALLLDTSRVIDSKERNFHIFYQLLNSDEYRKKYRLKEVKDYHLLNNEGTEMNDTAEFTSLMKCFSNLAIPTEKLFSIIALILHLSVNDFDAAMQLYPSLESEKLSSIDISKQIMILYVHLFDSIVKTVNSKLTAKQPIKSFLTMIDFPGFTDSGSDFGHFAVNTFNDLFNAMVTDIQFKKEQDLYILERIDWKFMEF
jgi:myosin heavy subunit